jgi:hypothetical protein
MTKTAVQEPQVVAPMYSSGSSAVPAASFGDNSPEMMQLLATLTKSLELPEELPMTEGYNLVLADNPPPPSNPISYGLCQISGNTASICYNSIVALMRSLLQSSICFFNNATAQNEAANESAEKSYDQNRKSANKQYAAGMYQATVSLGTGLCTAAGAVMPYTNSTRLGTDKMAPAYQKMGKAEFESNELQANQAKLHTAKADSLASGGTSSTPYDKRFEPGSNYRRDVIDDLTTSGRISEKTINKYYNAPGEFHANRSGSANAQIREDETEVAFTAMNPDEQRQTDMALTRGIHDANARVNTQQSIITQQTTFWNTMGNMLGSFSTAGFTIAQKHFEKEATVLQGKTKLWDSSSSQTNNLAQQWSSAAIDAAKESRDMLNTIQATVRASALN